MNVHERIRERRKELELTAEEVADAIGVSRATYYRYETADANNLPTSLIAPLANILKTTPAYLMGWEPDKKLGKTLSKLSDITDNEIIDMLYDISNMTTEELQMLKAAYKIIKSNILN